jgi:hypothetical protein
MADKAVKGTRDANATVKTFSQQMNNAWMLYVQDAFSGAAANHTYYMSRWQYFDGGVYTVQMASDDSMTMFIDSTQIGTAGMAVSTFEYVTVDQGWHRLDVSYFNGPLNTPAYAGWAFYNSGNVVPESISDPNGMIGNESQWPDIGAKPAGSGSNILSLPVFLPEPNWGDGITESWAWLSTVQTSETGAEQRRKIRRFPRRYVEAQFRGLKNKRRAIEMAIIGLGRDQCLIPLWFDTQFIKWNLTEKETVIHGDFTYRNYYAGGVAILRNMDRSKIFDYELVPILEVHNDRIVLATGLKKDWSNFRLFPCRVSVIEDAVQADNYTNAAADFQVRFRVVTAESFIQPSWIFNDVGWPRNGRDNLPIINQRPNWKENISHSFDRVVFWTDNQTGIPYVMDAGNQETQDWSLPWLLKGKKEKFTFIQMLYAMAGQTQPFYAPNWLEDFTLVEDINPATGYIAVEQTGYSYYADLLQEIRRNLYLEKRDGTALTARIVSSRAEDGVEYLYLDQTIGSIAKEDIRVLCFMPYCRLASDTVEITHHADLTGPAECVLALHGFIERRDGAPAVFP